MNFPRLCLILLVVCIPEWALGGEPAGAGKGRNTIEFDEKWVEGMGAKDLSASRHTGENRGKKGERLIREKTDFHEEMKRSLREVPWVQ